MAALTKTLKASVDPLLKTSSLTIMKGTTTINTSNNLVDLAKASDKICQEMYNNGITFFLSAQIQQTFKQDFSDSDYLAKLILLTSTLLRAGFGKVNFVST